MSRKKIYFCSYKSIFYMHTNINTNTNSFRRPNHETKTLYK